MKAPSNEYGIMPLFNPKEGGGMIKTASIFSQLLRFFPQTEFTRIVREHGAESHSKGFTSWSQFVELTRYAGA